MFKKFSHLFLSEAGKETVWIASAANADRKRLKVFLNDIQEAEEHYKKANMYIKTRVEKRNLNTYYTIYIRG